MYKLLAVLCASSTVALFGCADTGRYIYTPAEHAEARLASNGLPAALYQVPADHPQGEVKIASLGVRRTREHGRQLVVRMIVTNNSDQPWAVDWGQQYVLFADGTREPPTLVYRPEQSDQPESDVPPREQRRYDLLFDVPGKLRVVDFQIAWAINTPTELASSRTTFRREEVSPAYAAYGPNYGFYTDAYYDPPFYTFAYTSPYTYGPGIVVGHGYHPTNLYGGRVVPPPPPAATGPVPTAPPAGRAVPAPPPAPPPQKW